MQSKTARPTIEPAKGSPRAWLLPLLAAVAGAALLFGVTAHYYAPRPSVLAPPNLIVNLMPPSYVGAAATLTVGYAYPPTSPLAFLVSLGVNGTTSAAVPMPTVSGIGAGVTVSPLGYVFRIDWVDEDSDGRLSTGDTFTITSLQNPAPCCLTETFTILRQADGGMVTSISFGGPPVPSVIPVVALGTPSRGTPTNVNVPVTYVDPATPPEYLRYQIVVGGSASALAPVEPYGYLSNVSVAGGEYVVAWYDTTSDHLVDAGDAFNITLVSGSWPAAGTSMGFYLEWQDGTVLASALWTS